MYKKGYYCLMLLAQTFLPEKLPYNFFRTGNIYARLWILQTSVWHPQGFLEIPNAVHQLPLLGTAGKFGCYRLVRHSGFQYEIWHQTLSIYRANARMTWMVSYSIINTQTNRRSLEISSWSTSFRSTWTDQSGSICRSFLAWSSFTACCSSSWSR